MTKVSIVTQKHVHVINHGTISYYEYEAVISISNLCTRNQLVHGAENSSGFGFSDEIVVRKIY